MFALRQEQACLWHVAAGLCGPVRRIKGEHLAQRTVTYLSPTPKLEADMSKSDVQEAVKRAERQVENTSAGGHLGGTYYGQNPDGKTASTNTNVGKNRPNTGSS
jgi:hypothetical protein